MVPKHQENNTSFTNSELFGANIAAAAPETSEAVPELEVEVKQRRRAFWRRKWSFQDVAFASLILIMHLLTLLAPFNFNWSAFWVFMALYIITLLGMTLSFHRNLAHRSFKLPKWLEYFFAYCASHTFQKDPIYWVSVHRYHHQFTDTERDPHSPSEGFWFSHMGWLFDSNYILEKCGRRRNVEDLKKQPFYRFLAKTYVLHPIALGILLYVLGGLPFLVWGMGARITLRLQLTFLVNSAAHSWGKRAWKTNDLSKNNWILGLLVFGEGWHNNHHAFEYSARHGLEWWQLDVAWYIVRFLQAVGLATDVRTPTEIHMKKMALNNGSKIN